MICPISARPRRSSWSTISSSCCAAISATRARRQRPARKGNGAQPADPAGGLAAAGRRYSCRQRAARQHPRPGRQDGAQPAWTAAPIVNFLRGLMNSSAAPRDQRWQDRYDNLPRQVDSIAGEDRARAGCGRAQLRQCRASGTAPPPPPPPPPPHHQAQGRRHLQRRGRRRARRSRTRSRYFGNGCCSTTIFRCSPCSAPSPPTNCPAMRSGSE